MAREYAGQSISSNAVLERLISRYEAKRRPLSVDFRRIVDGLVPDRFTHLLHPYPAKLLIHIPHFFLSSTILSNPGDVVLDPFCGSGTVLLEAQIAGRATVGADANPLARLISTVKTRPLPEDKLNDALDSVLATIPRQPGISPPDVVNLDYWFHPHVIKQLVSILEAIEILQDLPIKDFFYVCFSLCARKVSLADPRLNVPVRLRQGQYPVGHWLREKTDAHIRRLRRVNVLKVFKTISEANIRRMGVLYRTLREFQLPVICADARNLVPALSENDNKCGQTIPNSSVQLAITSPPYPGAQKYVRSMSLSMGWLDICSSSELRRYKEMIIGREEYRQTEHEEDMVTGIQAADRILVRIRKINPLRAHIAANYLIEMKQALRETARVIRRRGYLVLVAGDNEICGKRFRTTEYLRLSRHFSAG